MKDAATLYAERSQLIDDALTLRESARVANATRVNAFPFYEYGVTIAEAMRDYEKATEAILRYHREFQPDIGTSLSTQLPAPVLDAVGIKNLRYAGSGGLDENSTFQYIEYPTLEEEEYDEFFADPTGFAYRKWLPRCFSVFEPFANMDHMAMMGGGWMDPMINFTSPAVIDSCKRLITASEEFKRFNQACGVCSAKLKEAGFPSIVGGGSATAFDMLGDGLRGTFGMMYDLKLQPENVHKAIDYFADAHIRHSVDLYKLTGNKYQWVMLHKGSDEFIGDDDYAEFYWPSLRKWILALIDQGIVPVVFCEGTYTKRLKFLKDVPKGKVIYLFETVDIRLAKQELGDVACIMGGFPMFTVTHGTPDQIRDLVKEYMDVLAPGGGYIFSLSASVDMCPRANMEALFDAVEQYGRK